MSRPRRAAPGRRAAAAALLLSTFGAVGSGCGGPQAPVIVPTAFTEDHERIFENGLDMVRDPDALEGAWLDTWEQELDRRVTEADVVALVTVGTLRTDVDLERRQTIRLAADPDEVLLGSEQVGDDLLLSVREGQGGFGTVRANERRLLDEQFFLFLKWQRDEPGPIRARWHLSPASDQVAERVRALLEQRRQVMRQRDPRRRVIIHRN